MVDLLDKFLLYVIGKMGTNLSIPWKYTAWVMFHRDKWYRKYRAWCKSCKQWVPKVEMEYRVDELTSLAIEFHPTDFCTERTK